VCGPSGGVNIPLCIIPLWDAALTAAETARGVACRAVPCAPSPSVSFLPVWDGPASIPSTESRCGRSATITASSYACTWGRPRVTPSRRGIPTLLGFNNAMASLTDWPFSGNLLRFPTLKLAYSEGQIGWIPYVLERADTVWEMYDGWLHAKERIAVPPSTRYYGPTLGCFTADRPACDRLRKSVRTTSASRRSCASGWTRTWHTRSSAAMPSKCWSSIGSERHPITAEVQDLPSERRAARSVLATNIRTVASGMTM
jgi:hypothetical protein